MKKRSWLLFSIILIVIILIVLLVIFTNENIFSNNQGPAQEELNVCEETPIYNYWLCENGSITCFSEECSKDYSDCTYGIDQNQRNACYIQLAEKYIDNSLCDYVVNNTYDAYGQTERCIKKAEKARYISDNSVEGTNNYTIMINRIVRCNANYLYESMGNCYSEWNRGCYYDYYAKECPTYSGVINFTFAKYGFSKQESLNLCEKFIDEGQKEYCLNVFS